MVDDYDDLADGTERWGNQAVASRAKAQSLLASSTRRPSLTVNVFSICSAGIGLLKRKP